MIDDGLGGDGIDNDDMLSPTGSSTLPSPVPRKSFLDLKREFFASQLNVVDSTVKYGNGTNQIVAHYLSNITPVDIDEREDSYSERFWNCMERCFLSLICSNSFKRSPIYRNPITYFNTVDRRASRLFQTPLTTINCPCTFITALFIYWSSYTYIL